MSIRFNFLLSLLLFYLPSTVFAEAGIAFSQSEGFWSVVSKVQSGVKDLNSANQLLNRLYGHPEGDQLSLVYQDQAFSDLIKLKEFKIEQLGFVYASNPVLPNLFGWLGAGGSFTLAYRWADLFSGHYWAKYVSAASTDLIDRTLLQSDQLNYEGLGFNFAHDLGEATPMHLEFHSKHAYFSSNLLGSEWVHRMNASASLQAMPSASVQLILGPEPVPHFEDRSLVWDYLWKTDLQSEFLSLLGAGVDLTPTFLSGVHILLGFYGGYAGGGIYWRGENFNLALSTYGFETAAAFQARQLRTFGIAANLNL